MRRLLVLVIALVCLSFSPALSGLLARAVPQIGGVSHAGHTANPAMISLAVDGSVTPQAIDDERAYHHFLKAIATIKDPAGRDAALRAVGLTPADRAAFAKAVLPTADQLAAIAQERKANPQRTELRDQERTAMNDARVRVLTALSIEGQALLDAFIQTHVKRRIKIFRGPMPAPVQGAQR